MSFAQQSLVGPKYISLTVSTANQILYTVPLGRSFRGTLILNASAQFSINGGANIALGATAVVIPNFVLGPGSYIQSATSNAITLVGIES